MSEPTERTFQPGLGSIKVKVRAYAMLRSHLPGLPLGSSALIETQQGCSAGDLLDRLGIPRTQTKSLFVNGLKQDFGYVLKDGDELAVFPPIAGG